jgi:hypothetical protein
MSYSGRDPRNPSWFEKLAALNEPVKAKRPHQPKSENDYDVGKELVRQLRRTQQCSAAYTRLCARLHLTLEKLRMLEVLNQCVNQGPVEDGDIISRVQRNYLLSLHLLQRVYVKGQQGYTAATYMAGNVLTPDPDDLRAEREQQHCAGVQ